MSLAKLGLDQLKECGLAAVDAMFRFELSRALADIQEKPGDKAPRKVTLIFCVEPETNQQGVVTDAALSVSCQSSLPKQKSRKVNVALSPDGELLINKFDHDNVKQRSLAELTEKESE